MHDFSLIGCFIAIFFLHCDVSIAFFSFYLLFYVSISTSVLFLFWLWSARRWQCSDFDHHFDTRLFTTNEWSRFVLLLFECKVRGKELKWKKIAKKKNFLFNFPIFYFPLSNYFNYIIWQFKSLRRNEMRWSPKRTDWWALVAFAWAAAALQAAFEFSFCALVTFADDNNIIKVMATNTKMNWSLLTYFWFFGSSNDAFWVTHFSLIPTCMDRHYYHQNDCIVFNDCVDVFKMHFDCFLLLFYSFLTCVQ